MTGSTQPSLRSLGREPLLEWFRNRDRAYPWRRTLDPYRVLVSEVMLQQTAAARVARAYPAFLRRFPRLRILALAPRRDVVAAWGGLGYNRRAVALSEAARTILRDHSGRVPPEPLALQELPGVGPYTAAAVASIAFGVPVAAIDTNIRRVVARVFAGTEPHDLAPATLHAIASGWLDRRRPGAWNQALMDLGREVCRPRPRCSVCPLAAACRFRSTGAVPHPPRQAGSRFDGSMRQARGAVIRVLRAPGERTLATLAREIGFADGRVLQAIRGLTADGLVEASESALAGNPRGRVRLTS